MLISSSIALIPLSGAVSTPDDDAIPENIGVVREYSGIKISYTRRFDDENGVIPVGAGVGAHGAYETRIVRTENGTYAAFITDATGEPTAAHPGWDCGVATFSIVKITATGFERIFTAEYPQALGSCTPNIVQGENGIVYVVIIADDKDRRQTEYCNGVWLEVYKLDTATDTVTKPGGTQKYRHTTSPTDDHGYGYTQPIFDFEHGKMYALTCGGEAPGYLAWWIYNLETDRWSSTCHTIQLFTRRCYINGYADGNGGFTIVIERCAPIATLASALGVQFTSSGYGWDGLYIMHIPNANVNSFTDTVIREPSYTSEGYNNTGKNRIDTVSHYGNSGCTYLDDQSRVHVIYSHKNGNTKKTSIYHAVYDLSGNELFHQLIPTSLIPKNGAALSLSVASFAMTQDTDGTYYVFVEDSASTAAMKIWKSPADDGFNFTQVVSSTTLKSPSGDTFSKGKYIIGNSRNYSEKDGYVPLMFEGSSGGDCFYYTCIALPHAGEEASTHTHTWNGGAVTSQPTCTEPGVKTYTCTGCGATRTESVAATGHTWGAAVIATQPTCTATGIRMRTCTVCGTTNTQTVPSLGGHLWDDGVVTLEPTYTAPGEMTFTCTRCGETYVESIPVKEPIPGDANGDGKCTVSDVSLMKRHIAGLVSEDQLIYLNADVNGDGKVNATDITRIKRYIATGSFS